jgi:NADPH:quinone reductase-like Zn-dependent oxidoreductase
MLSIIIPNHTTPENYELGEVPTPIVDNPKDILIKTRATSINPIDVKKASGASKLVLKDRSVPRTRALHSSHPD